MKCYCDVCGKELKDIYEFENNGRVISCSNNPTKRIVLHTCNDCILSVSEMYNAIVNYKRGNKSLRGK